MDEGVPRTVLGGGRKVAWKVGVDIPGRPPVDEQSVGNCNSLSVGVRFEPTPGEFDCLNFKYLF